jgi:phage shock protein C
MTAQRLYRSRMDRMLAGICGGLAHYFAIDPTLVRLFFVLAAVFSGGLFIVAYLILWMVVPEDRGEMAAPTSMSSMFGTTESGETPPSGDAGSFGSTSPWSGFSSPRYTPEEYRQRRTQWFGWALLGLGLLILVSNLHLLSFLQLGVTWPIFLILAGVFLLMRQRQHV